MPNAAQMSMLASAVTARCAVAQLVTTGRRLRRPIVAPGRSPRFDGARKANEQRRQTRCFSLPGRYVGPLCATCESNHFRNLATHGCESCEDASSEGGDRDTGLFGGKFYGISSLLLAVLALFFVLSLALATVLLRGKSASFARFRGSSFDANTGADKHASSGDDGVLPVLFGGCSTDRLKAFLTILYRVRRWRACSSMRWLLD